MNSYGLKLLQQFKIDIKKAQKQKKKEKTADKKEKKDKLKQLKTFIKLMISLSGNIDRDSFVPGITP